jgi:hypothetical protein
VLSAARGERNLNSESAEEVDFEFAPDSAKRQYLQGAGHQDSPTEVNAAGARKHRASCVQAGRSPDTLMANADSTLQCANKGRHRTEMSPDA